jgi:ATP-dependent RNA helicase DDX49/DBP8
LTAQWLFNPRAYYFFPCRLADHIRSCATFSLKRIRYLVIDEADRMFDGSFDAQLSDIFAAVPPPESRQTLLFTATVSDTLRKLMQISEQNGKNPFFFEETPNSNGLNEDQLTPEQLEQRFVMTPVEARDG